MLTTIELSYLQTHILGLFQTVIVPEINPNGYVLVMDTDGQTYPDIVTTHHLVELCLEISPVMTKDVVDRACHWFLKSNNNIQNPFLLTTLASAKKLSTSDMSTILNKALIPNQKPSGFIDMYAGFLDGGSAFSTLWAIRIASLLGDGSKPIIEKAFNAIETHWDDLNRVSFKGFYYELTNMFSRSSQHSTSVLHEILDNQSDIGSWDNSDLYTAYIVGNLMSGYSQINEENVISASKGLKYLFELNKEANGIPMTFSRARENLADSAFIQLCIRSLISAIRFLRKSNGIDVREQLSASLFGLLPQVYHSARVLDAELKQMNNQYGGIKITFDHLEKKATESILRESPYDKNVFIMMPFRHEDDERYERIVTSIKKTLAKYGFKGWMASDKNIANQLWDNVACFMLACKYGISIFTRVERETEIRVKEFNPNVSLELGFFLSRGKKVLILKDTILPSLQTDLVGHLYEPFDLNKSGAQIPKVIKKWIKSIIEEEIKESEDENKVD